MAPLPNAKRQSTELAAKAINAKLVSKLIFNSDLLIICAYEKIGIRILMFILLMKNN